MDLNKLLPNPNEKPLDSFPEGISNTAIFRSIAFIGDSLSSGEFESRDSEGKPHFHDMYEYSWGQYIARKNGLKAYNFSRGGMSAKWFIKSFADEKDFGIKTLLAKPMLLLWELTTNQVASKLATLKTIKTRQKKHSVTITAK